jgi:hypothetical protein
LNRAAGCGVQRASGILSWRPWRRRELLFHRAMGWAAVGAGRHWISRSIGQPRVGPVPSGRDRLVDPALLESGPGPIPPGAVGTAEEPPCDLAGQLLRAAFDGPEFVGRPVAHLDLQSERLTCGKDLLLDWHSQPGGGLSRGEIRPWIQHGQPVVHVGLHDVRDRPVGSFGEFDQHDRFG